MKVFTYYQTELLQKHVGEHKCSGRRLVTLLDVIYETTKAWNMVKPITVRKIMERDFSRQ
jgi:hypothetical protein